MSMVEHSRQAEYSKDRNGREGIGVMVSVLRTLH